MQWLIGFIAAVIFLIAAIMLSVFRGTCKRLRVSWLTPDNILFVGVALSLVALFIPIYKDVLADTAAGPIEAFVASIHNMIRLFVVDCDFAFITDNLPADIGWLATAYSILFSVLYVVAPLLTFSFMLSFFQNAAAYRRMLVHYKSDIYVFSELNEQSLILATSLYEDHPKKSLFVFADVFSKDEETSFELISRAKRLGAVCFKKDMLTIQFGLHSKHSAMTFFAIGTDQSENINQALKLIERYRERERTNLYVFADQIEAELLLFPAPDERSETKMNIRVRRIQESSALVNHVLYDKGMCLFDSALRSTPHETARIGAVVIGADESAVCMTKALPWFCQMDGYRVHVYAFSEEEGLADRMLGDCPELLDDRYNDRFDDPGEAQYSLKIHDNVRLEGHAFFSMLTALPEVTYLFISTGDDEKNIRLAVRLRSLFRRHHTHPVIHAVVHNSEKKQALCDIRDFKGTPFDIDFVGDLQKEYSYKTILESVLEKEALARHMRWGDEETFWRYHYNYSSSVASAIHQRMKRHCALPGFDRPASERTEEERRAIRMVEHRRWNAYMRSQGYCYDAKRDDLAKTHHDLVSFDCLDAKTQAHDDD